MNDRSGLRITRLLVLITALVFLMSAFSESAPCRTDECPHLLLSAACYSRRKEDCCSRYIAEAHGNLGTNLEKLHFNWSISNGRITSGQGTPSIKFEASSGKGEAVEIRVKVDGLNDWPQVCAKDVSITIDRCKDRKKSGHS